MKPKGKPYENPIVIPKVWERIVVGFKKNIGNITDNVLVTKEVSNYIRSLEKELKVTDELLENQYRVIDEIPECKTHGKRCVPNAIDWIKDKKTAIKGDLVLSSLLLKSKEVISTTGLRFNGVSDEEIKQVFKKHGADYESPF